MIIDNWMYIGISLMMIHIIALYVHAAIHKTPTIPMPLRMEIYAVLGWLTVGAMMGPLSIVIIVIAWNHV